MWYVPFLSLENLFNDYVSALSLSYRILEMFQPDWLMKGFLAPMCSAERRCQVGGGGGVGEVMSR